MNMKKICTPVLSIILTIATAHAQPVSIKAGNTICNPLNLSYRYMPDKPSRREAADPTMILFKDEYYLFASKSSSYWWSHDLIDWHLVETNQIPIEDYAPTVVAVGDTVYFLASSSIKCPVYKSGDPKSGHWEIVKDSLPFTVTDPALFLDDDTRLYLYWGCSPTDPIHGVELDKKTFEPIGTPGNFIIADTRIHGWEIPGDDNELSQKPWIEGSWMNKYNGKYYLQYAAPGTEYFSYADGVYISDNPLGPFTYAFINPFSYKPGGYIRGAGHGSTFTDRYGNIWHVSTMTISVLHKFERRIGLFPAHLDQKGNLIADAGMTEVPIIIPDHKISDPKDLSTRWMLLSYGTPVVTSSFRKEYPPSNAVDENIRTSWCAKSGLAGEWLKIDLQRLCTIRALQINFADIATNIFSRDSNCYYQYIIECSDNDKSWSRCIDKSTSKMDSPHDYIQLPIPVNARYIRLTIYHVPGGPVAVSDIRVFGSGTGKKPSGVTSFNAVRKQDNRCTVTLSWKKAAGATGYTIHFGPNASSMPFRYPVYSDTSLTVRSLNADEKYYFNIESFNENGVLRSKEVLVVK
jgi:xylan 1,4-beta-xylosidase